jgi:hypothetical protein
VLAFAFNKIVILLKYNAHLYTKLQALQICLVYISFFIPLESQRVMILKALYKQPLFLSLLIAGLPLTAAPISYSLRIKDSKKMLIVGDIHTSSPALQKFMPLVDKSFIKIFSTIITLLTIQPYTTNFILECNPLSELILPALIKIIYSSPESIDTLNAVRCNVYTQGTIQRNLIFHLEDPRIQIGHIFDLFAEASKDLNADPKDIVADIETLKKSYSYFKKSIDTASIKDCMSEANLILERSSKALSLCSRASSAGQEYLAKLHQRAAGTLQGLSKILDNWRESFYPRDSDIMATPLMDLLKTELATSGAETARDRLSLYHTLEHAFAELTLTLGDIVFITSTLNALEIGDSIVCYVGNAHAYALDNFLDKIGFICSDTKGYLANTNLMGDIIKTDPGHLFSQINGPDLEKAFMAFINFSFPPLTTPSLSTAIDTAGTICLKDAGETSASNDLNALCQKSDLEKQKSNCQTL